MPGQNNKPAKENKQKRISHSIQRNKWYQQVFKGGGSSGSLHLIHSEKISFSVAVVKTYVKYDKVSNHGQLCCAVSLVKHKCLEKEPSSLHFEKLGGLVGTCYQQLWQRQQFGEEPGRH